MVVTVSVSKRKPRKPPQQQPGQPAQPAKPATPKPEEPDPGPGPGPDPTTGHNGGRSQLNFNFIQTGDAFPFINAIKTAQTWSLQDNTAYPAPDTLDTNGYPVSLSNGGLATVFNMPTQAHRPGNWRLRWKGAGRVALSDFAATTATDGDFTVTTPKGGPQQSLQILTAGGVGITHIEYFHEDDEAAYDAGAIFNPDFIAALRKGNWGVLRFLNWQSNNNTNVRYWSDGKSEDYFSYASSDFRANIFAGTTTNSGDDYSCPAPPNWTGFVDKAQITVKFNASATTDNPTLAVGGTAAKIIRRFNGVTVSAGSNTRPLANVYGTLTYDADLDCLMKYGGDIADGGRFLNNAMPISVMLALCVEVGAHPWIIPPYLSCDPITDWMTECASYFKENAPAWMIPRFEAQPNECWNTGSGAFHSSHYANNKATALWGIGANSFSEWVGKVASTNGQAISEVYGDDRARYQCVLGLWTHGGQTNQNARLASTQYVAQDGGDPAKNWVTHVAMANYYNDTFTSDEETTAVEAWAAGDAAEKLVQVTAYVDSTLDPNDAPAGNTQFGIPQLLVLAGLWKAWAQDYDPSIKLTFYEGGWSPDYTTTSGIPVSDLDKFRQASKAVASLKQITTDLYDDLIALGDVEFPSHFCLSGPGAWSLFELTIYNTPSPQYDAIITFNTP